LLGYLACAQIVFPGSEGVGLGDRVEKTTYEEGKKRSEKTTLSRDKRLCVKAEWQVHSKDPGKIASEESSTN